MSPFRRSLAVAVAKIEMARDVRSGRVPATCAGFVELHDYVDANRYGEGVFGYPSDEERDEWVDEVYAAQLELDEWIRGGGLRRL